MERQIYRIIDANFNRGREALRTMEEFCRFILENELLAGRAKQIRHRLSSTVGKLDSRRLLSERDADTDVGRGLKIEDAQQRVCINDCFTAAAKRGTEALRVLAEMMQVEHPELSADLEKLRFETYTLEKEIHQILPRSRFLQVRLYILIPAGQDMTNSQVIDLAKACIDGGADALQLRAQGLSDDRLFELALEFVVLCKKGNCISIINDRADIAALTEADGLHLGQHDLPIEKARKLLFKPALIGLSTHNEQELRSAIESGADYVGIGACFPTPTKPQITVSGLDYIHKAITILKDSSVGHVAIGGITFENIQTILDAGVRSVAVSSTVCEAQDPRRVCRELKRLIIDNNP